MGASYGYPNPELRFIGVTEGMSGRAFTTGEPVIAPDVRKDPDYIAQVSGMRSAAAVPLRYEGRIVGAFNLEAASRTFKRSDLAILVPLADQIAAVVENRRLRSEAQSRADSEQKTRKELQAISSVVMAGVAAVNDLDAALDSMIAEISLQMGWDSMALLLFEDGGMLHTRAYYGYPEFSTKVRFGPGEGIVGTVAATGTGRLVEDVTHDADYLDVVGETRSEICVPLVVGERTLGVLNAESTVAHRFSESEFRLLQTLADQMAVVVERARLAQLERRALDQMRELDQLKDDFISTVSHELRTPLTSINGYARTLMARNSNLDDEQRRAFLDIIVRQCARLANMVESLLLVSRLEAGQVGFKPVYVLTRDVLRDAAESADATERVKYEIEDGAGIVTDQFRLHHILRNLIENACKYSPEATQVLVRAANVDEGLCVEVLDQGPGIPDGMEDAIFERFRPARRLGHLRRAGNWSWALYFQALRARPGRRRGRVPLHSCRLAGRMLQGDVGESARRSATEDSRIHLAKTAAASVCCTTRGHS